MVICVAALVVLAGCASPTSPTGSTSTNPHAAPGPCDVARPAAVHRDGTNVTTPLVAFPCLGQTGFHGGETELGIARDGHVFVGTLNDQSLATGAPVRVAPQGIARSDDNGTTWRLLAPSAAGAPTHPTTLDPTFYLDPATGRLFADDLEPNCSLLSWSDDEGATWTSSLVGCGMMDHQTLFAGKPVSSPTVGYPNVLYYCAYDAGGLTLAGSSAGCQKSLDGGLTWIFTGAPAFPPATGQGNYGLPVCNAGLGHGTVGPDGTIYLPSGQCTNPLLAISHDEGLTWTRVAVSTLTLPGGGEHDGDAIWGHETGVGVDSAGNVYYLWTSHDRIPLLAISKDSGATWSQPVRVGIPGLRQAVFPELIAWGPGRIAIAYMGSTNAPLGPYNETTCFGNLGPCIQDIEDTPGSLGVPGVPAHQTLPAYRNATWNGYLAMSVDALDPHPTFMTASVNDPKDPLVRGECGVSRCQEASDFVDVRIGPDGTPWASFTDGCEDTCATGQTMTDNANEVVVGRLWDGPDLRGD